MQHSSQAHPLTKSGLLISIKNEDLQGPPSVLPSMLDMQSTIYAIGDVHGRSDLLARLIDFIGKHVHETGRNPQIFFLGDIVDRGHDSLGAMEIVRKTIDRWPGSRLFLGNHEKMFIEMLENPNDESLRQKFVRNGGGPTLVSYIGYDGPYSPEEVADISVRFQDHIILIRNSSRIEIVGKYAFVHAGIDPRIAISEQDEKDLIWIRERFLDHIGPLSHIVVHGHTMLEPTLPVVTENRISLDTGAYHSGVLSMAVIAPETGAVEFYATHRDGSVQGVEPVFLERSSTITMPV